MRKNHIWSIQKSCWNLNWVWVWKIEILLYNRCKSCLSLVCFIILCWRFIKTFGLIKLSVIRAGIYVLIRYEIPAPTIDSQTRLYEQHFAAKDTLFSILHLASRPHFVVLQLQLPITRFLEYISQFLITPPVGYIVHICVFVCIDLYKIVYKFIPSSSWNCLWILFGRCHASNGISDATFERGGISS